MTPEELKREEEFQEDLRIGLEEQWKFAAEPILAKTGKGFLRSSGVVEMQQAKEIEKEEERKRNHRVNPLCNPILWLSDLHFDHYIHGRVEPFLEKLSSERRPGTVLITGDISRSTELREHLKQIAKAFRCPVYFILGNHDFYGSSFVEVDEMVLNVCRENPRLNRLGYGEIIPLSSKTALIGCDGWADGLAGNGFNSQAELNDFYKIAELIKSRRLSHRDLFNALKGRGEAFAKYIKNVLPDALKSFEKVIVLTHVPPFPEAALYEGKPSEPDFAPHFCSVSMGEVLREIGLAHPNKKIQVLCGHTHHAADFQALTNLRVIVNGSDYREPDVRTLEIDDKIQCMPNPKEFSSEEVQMIKDIQNSMAIAGFEISDERMLEYAREAVEKHRSGKVNLDALLAEFRAKNA